MSKEKEAAKQAWQAVKEYMLGDKRPFVPSEEIALLDRYLSDEQTPEQDSQKP